MMESNGDTNTGKEVTWKIPRGLRLEERSGSFLDHVQQFMQKLLVDEEFCQYLDAVSNRSSIEGKVEYDRAKAAEIIRAEALSAGVMDVATAKLAKIVRSIEKLLSNNKCGRKVRLAALVAPQVSPAE